MASAGRGAKGLFALDVSTPGTFGASQVLWEYDGALDPDLGYVLGRPQIATLEDDTVAVDRWEWPQQRQWQGGPLHLQPGDRCVIRRIDTQVGGDNGMSTPTLWDSDGNGKIDTIYAGDLKGNVWRLDPSGTAAPFRLFTAQFVDSDGNVQPQPITAQVTVARNTRTSDPNYGKTFVFFGTGSYVYAADPADTQIQSWYGLIDDGTVISVEDLKERQFDSNGTVAGYAVRVFGAVTAGDMTDKKGWYIDLDYPAAGGERIVTRSNVYQFLEPVLLASSIIPDSDPCRAGGGGYINAIDPFTGGRLSYSPVDLNDDGLFDAERQPGGQDHRVLRSGHRHARRGRNNRRPPGRRRVHR